MTGWQVAPWGTRFYYVDGWLCATLTVTSDGKGWEAIVNTPRCDDFRHVTYSGALTDAMREVEEEVAA